MPTSLAGQHTEDGLELPPVLMAVERMRRMRRQSALDEPSRGANVDRRVDRRLAVHLDRDGDGIRAGLVDEVLERHDAFVTDPAVER